MTGTLAIAQRIYQAADWLGGRLVDLANEALTAHEAKTYSLAIQKAGACLEAILTRILVEHAGSTEPPKTLGPLIGACRESGVAPSELLKRLDDVNNIRNRASHDHPNELMKISEADSLQALNILGLTASWCGSTLGLVPSEPGEEHEVRIFLSVGSPHRLDQEQFLNALRSQLRLMGVKLVSLVPSEYSPDQPFDQVRRLMRECRAALIVGLERSHAYTVFERENSDREILHQDQFIPTAWNQVEGSIASALEIEVLILRESQLHREGIFEAGNHRHRIRDYSLGVESKGLSAELSGFLSGWIDSLKSTAANAHGRKKTA